MQHDVCEPELLFRTVWHGLGGAVSADGQSWRDGFVGGRAWVVDIRDLSRVDRCVGEQDVSVDDGQFGAGAVESIGSWSCGGSWDHVNSNPIQLYSVQSN